MNLWELPAHRLAAMLQRREVSVLEVAEAFLQRTECLDERLGTFTFLDPDEVRSQAVEAQRRLDAGERPTLLGVPVAIKDNICVKDEPTTCASRILSGYRPPYDATVVEKLRAAGAVLFGKANCDEFAMGSSTESSAWQPTRNPWDLDRVPGGSSGGSAAAVAAGLVPLALGSDTGGSVRQPAAMCGVVGLKPTYGRVSRYGLVAFSSSLDQIGPLAREVQDAAMLFEAIAGYDRRDATSVDTEVPRVTLDPDDALRGRRIGLPSEFLGEGVDPAVAEVVRTAVSALGDAGAIVEETSVPSVQYGVETYYIIAPAEASSNLARYDGIRYGHRAEGNAGHVGLVEQTREEGFGPEVKRRILLGTYALSAGYYDAYYLKAQKVRTRMRHEFEERLRTYDYLMGPTSPIVAFGIGELQDDLLAMKMADILTIPANLAGLAAISVPCGFAHGLPVGLQFISRPFDEAGLLRVAHAYEQRTEWHRLRPPEPAAA
ncbi:MAG: Asp-tRNA(Asn)/Glu-tRNA(Gln) amidotransferase subunit GatA [Fimbriimonadia bacterium]|jgi:aspartyl-tRNA(Asn)/glutamyl-tRNA(Gln) amidotransferase subunit A